MRTHTAARVWAVNRTASRYNLAWYPMQPRRAFIRSVGSSKVSGYEFLHDRINPTRVVAAKLRVAISPGHPR